MASITPDDVRNRKTSLASQMKTQPQSQSDPMQPFWKLARILGSLHLAISAGTVFTVAMIIGTCLESWYSDKIAQELIYHTWWFTLLLGLLGCCIFFAAVKKWPWKKHQTGFLITHIGLLTLLAGGVLNSFFGTDAVMSLVDFNAEQEQMKVPQRSDLMFLSQHQILTLQRKQSDGEGSTKWKVTEVEVKPGPLPWGSEMGATIPIPGLISGLAVLANPFPRTVHTQPYDDVRLEAIAHLPHSRVEPLEPAQEKEFGFPALKVEINTIEPNSRRPFRIKPAWAALNTERQRQMLPYLNNTFRSNMLVELLGVCPAPLINEFLKPPSDDDRSTLGTLVFHIKGTSYRFKVAPSIGKAVPLGDTGWKVKIESYYARPGSVDKTEQPDFPYVMCDVIAPDGKITKYQVAGRIVTYPGPLDHLNSPVTELEPGLPAAWYHAPDVRFGYDGQTRETIHIKHMVQFAQSTEGKLYYRSFVENKGKMTFESSGVVPPTGMKQEIWESLSGNFIIEEHIPHAKPCNQRVVPIVKRPGLQDEDHPAALLCRVSLTKKDASGKPVVVSKEQWVPLGQRLSTVFTLSGKVDDTPFSETFLVNYNYQQAKLPFSLELTRAESQADPGTTRAATYTSFVRLYDEGQNIFGDNFMITMNEPLDHRGFKVYQSRFSNFGIDQESGKPLAGSVFTIGRDPGLWLKYLGTGMLGLGIATMYYMKAYFFKPKAKPSVA